MTKEEKEVNMKYEIGNIVVLISGETVYITGYDKESKKYKGFLAETAANTQNEVCFSESDVLMKLQFL